MSSIAVKICLLLCLPLPLFSLTEPVILDVSEPSVQEPQITDVAQTTNTNAARAKIFPYKLRVQSYGGMTWYVDWHSPVIAIVLTNKVEKTMKIETIQVRDILSLTVSRWKPVHQGNGLYEFQPDKILLQLRDETLRELTGLPSIHILPVLQNGVDKKIYTIFYDKWIKGKSGIYRWKNSRAGSFNFNFSQPLPGTVVVIDFLNMPVQMKADK